MGGFWLYQKQRITLPRKFQVFKISSRSQKIMYTESCQLNLAIKGLKDKMDNGFSLLFICGDVNLEKPWIKQTLRFHSCITNNSAQSAKLVEKLSCVLSIYLKNLLFSLYYSVRKFREASVSISFLYMCYTVED